MLPPCVSFKHIYILFGIQRAISLLQPYFCNTINLPTAIADTTQPSPHTQTLHNIDFTQLYLNHTHPKNMRIVTV